ncbi:MAG TPA: hypothetical protein VF708_18630 [Pyrinomonadaceae bacterium]|jgi:hypothetical protein
MDIGKTSLTIEGKPGEEVRVLYRDRGDEPPPPIWEGKLGADGRVTIDVPQGYLVVLGSNGGQAVLELYKTKPASETVRL